MAVARLRVQRPAATTCDLAAATASMAHLLRVRMHRERIQVNLFLLRALRIGTASARLRPRLGSGRLLVRLAIAAILVLVVATSLVVEFLDVTVLAIHRALNVTHGYQVASRR